MAHGKFNLPLVLNWKKPGVVWQCEDKNDEDHNYIHTEIKHYEGDMPSQSDIDQWTAEYEAYAESIKYQNDRKKEYPSFEDQFDELYHNGVDGWKSKIKAVKDKYPKE